MSICPINIDYLKRQLTSLLLFYLIFFNSPLQSLPAQSLVRINFSAEWLRRDWKNCQDPTQLIQNGSSVTIISDTSAALFWQIPTRSGNPLVLDQNHSWIRKCNRPPVDFGRTIRRKTKGTGKLLNVSDYPYVTWKWRVDGTIDDSKTANSKGKIRKQGDDFAAKIGISILRKNSDDLREIAYVWTRTIPEESILTQETTVIPKIWKYTWHRIVAESGEKNLNRWTSVTRNLYADYKELYPDEEPGLIMRVYLMTDTDNTRSQITGDFANLMFLKRKPEKFKK